MLYVQPTVSIDERNECLEALRRRTHLGRRPLAAQHFRRCLHQLIDQRGLPRRPCRRAGRTAVGLRQRSKQLQRRDVADGLGNGTRRAGV